MVRKFIEKKIAARKKPDLHVDMKLGSGWHKRNFLAEVVVRDESELLSVTNAIRAVHGVVTTETFVYLDIAKQTYTYGVH